VAPELPCGDGAQLLLGPLARGAAAAGSGAASTQEIVGPQENSELFYAERDVGSTRLERVTAR